MSLKLIKSKSQSGHDYYRIYTDFFIRCIKNAASESKKTTDFDYVDRKRIVFSGIKMINFGRGERKSEYESRLAFNLINCINEIIKTLTPREFETIFPINKEYNGEKNGWKDYFYTKNYIDKHGWDIDIGEEVNEFLWEYQNWDVSFYLINTMSVIDELRRYDGDKGMMEEFLEDQGVTLHTMFTDENGKKFIRNNETGDVSRVRRKIPRHI